MNYDEKIEFYAKLYNTIQEIVWTADNEGLFDDNVRLLDKFLENLNKTIMEWKQYTEDQKDRFIFLTDHIRDRIYFNC